MFSKVEDLLEEDEQLEETIHPSRFHIRHLKWYAVVLLLGGLSIAGYAANSLVTGVIGIAIATWVFLYFGVVPLAALLFVEIKHRMVKYHFTDRKIVMESGIFNRDFISVPYQRITDTSLDQSLPEAIFSIGDILINTAGTDTAEMYLKGIRHPEEYKVMIGQRAAGQGGSNMAQRQMGGAQQQRDSLEAELGKITQQRKRLEQQYFNGEIPEDEYKKRWYSLQGREEEILNLLEQQGQAGQTSEDQRDG